MATTQRGLLATLGIDATEEDVYRALLSRPGATLAELQETTGLGSTRLRRITAMLELRAMVSRRGGKPMRFQAAPPDIVIEALVSAREHELEQAKLAAHQLTALLPPPAAHLDVTEVVEVLTSAEAVAERWAQLQTVTRSTLEVFDRPPYAQAASEDHEPLQSTLRGRGVVCRGVYDEDALSFPGTIEHLRHVTQPDAPGVQREHARVVSRLPIKMALFDRRTALVPLTQPVQGSIVDAGLVVHRSVLLDALIDLFNTHWHRGVDVSFADEQLVTGRGGTDESMILNLLAGGLKDDVIARTLGVSTHTVRRRIADIKDRLGATTRFQAGLALGRQGGLPAADRSPTR